MSSEKNDYLIDTLKEIREDVKHIPILILKIESLEKQYELMKESVHDVRNKAITKEQADILLDDQKGELQSLKDKINLLEKELLEIKEWKTIRQNDLNNKEAVKTFFGNFSLFIKKHALVFVIIIAILGVIGAWLADSPIHKQAIHRITKI